MSICIGCVGPPSAVPLQSKKQCYLRRVDVPHMPVQALRGGGGNFGVVVEFTFAPCAVAVSFPVARLVFDVAGTAELLQVYAEFTRQRPSERDGVTAYLFLSKGTNFVVVSDVTPTGNSEAAVESLRELVSPFLSLEPQVFITATTLPELNSSSDAGNAAGRMCVRKTLPSG
jgi:hypothetical protein